ncbi:hypothetical protein [Streptomyces sp. NPDC127190]|uniref:hypothetical protein n=1 Tax=unclassified Streptomyces TaxID=2593676 RepID=UPI003625F4D9
MTGYGIATWAALEEEEQPELAVGPHGVVVEELPDSDRAALDRALPAHGRLVTALQALHGTGSGLPTL